MSWFLRGTASAALAASGVLTFAAARERWWPACPRGGFDSPACVEMQDHARDYLVPTAPWEPVGHAAPLAGGALLALALAALTVPFVVRPHAWIGWWRPLLAATAVVPALALALLGGATLRAGATGLPTPGTASATLGVATFVWVMAWPAALTWVAARAPGPPRRTGGVVLAVLVGLSTPVPVLLVLGPVAAGYVSHDTAPWSEATAAPLLLLAAVTVWPAYGPGRRRRRRPVRLTVVPRTTGPRHRSVAAGQAQRPRSAS